MAVYPIGGYDEIPAKLDDGAVFADFFRLWKLQRALPDLHLYEVDDEIRNRYLFRPPLIYVPAGPAETDRGNGALARAFGAATEELLRGNWDASGYPFWTLGKSYFYEGTDKKQRDPLLRTYAEQTKLSFGEAAQAEAGESRWPDLDHAEGVLARVLGSGVLTVALGPNALASRSQAIADAAWAVSDEFEDWVLRGAALCLSKRAGRFIQVQTSATDAAGARGLARALSSSFIDMGIGMEARVCAAAVGAGSEASDASAGLARVFFGTSYLSTVMVAVVKGKDKEKELEKELFSGRGFVCRAGADVCAVAKAVFVQAPAGGASGASVTEVTDPVANITSSNLIYVDDWAHMWRALGNSGNFSLVNVGVPFLFAPVFR